MEADILFTEMIVRDFIMKNNGKVSNSDLVNHFKNFLNDPIRKNANRLKFKNYVNTLSMVKLDVDGSKLLVLRKKYRDDDYYFNYRETEDKAAQQKDNKDNIKESKSTEVEPNESSSTITDTPNKDGTQVLPEIPQKNNDKYEPKTPTISAVEQSIPEVSGVKEGECSSDVDKKDKDFCVKEKKEDISYKEEIENNKIVVHEIIELKGEPFWESSIIENSVARNEKDKNVDDDKLKDLAKMSEKNKEKSVSIDIKNDDIADETMVAGTINEAFEDEPPIKDDNICYREHSNDCTSNDSTLTSTNDPSFSSQSIEGLSENLHSLSMFNHYDDHTTSLPSINSEINNDSDQVSADYKHTLEKLEDDYELGNTTLTTDNIEHTTDSTTPQPDDSSNHSLSSSSTSLTSRNYQGHRDPVSMESSIAFTSSVTSLSSVDSKQHRSKKTLETTSSEFETMSDIDHEWLMVACESGYQSMSKLLQSNPKLAASRSVVTGYSALHWACKNGNTDIVKLLCGKHDVNPNTRTQGGYTPLHIATIHCHNEVIELLMKVYKADASVRDYSGKLPKAYSEQGSNRTRQMLNPRRMGSIIDYDQSILRHQPQYMSPNRGGKENSHPLASPISTKPFKPTDYSSLMPPPAYLPPIHRGKPSSKARTHSSGAIGGSSDSINVKGLGDRKNSSGELSKGGGDGGMDGDMLTYSDSEMGHGMGGLSLASHFFSSFPSVNKDSVV